MADGDSIRCCAHCGGHIVPRINKTTGLPSVRERAYCSKACKRKASWVREKPKPRVKRVRTPKQIEGFCPSCGLHFVRVRRGSIGGKADAGRYCSRKCFSAKQSRLRVEGATLRRIAANWHMPIGPAGYGDLVLSEVQALRRIANWAPGRTPTVRPCNGCGAKTIGTGEMRRRCAPCKEASRRESAARSKRTEAGRARRRVDKSRRRAVERGVSADRIDPIKVFERDGWRCHLCGRKTPKRLRGSYEPEAPELDHVVPLAVGGTHTWGNVKCACRKCNGAKADKPMGQIGLNIAA